jgi:quinol monooxygenase YgiN
MRTILNKDGNRCQLVSRPYPDPVLIVVNRFRVESDEDAFRAGLEEACELLAAQAGYAGGELGRNLDDPTLWLLTTRWENVGSYRRALSAYDVKLNAVPTLSRALDEPSAYESAAPGETLNEPGARRFG